MSARLDQSLAAGNEGAGTVVSAGSDVTHALGKRVAMFGGAMYAEFRCLKLSECMLLPEGSTAKDGASSFVNPLTALGMIETMRKEGHTALLHTAAASSLGQMLNRICLMDGVNLVNIVRNVEQEQTLRRQGARYVCNSTSETFMTDLIDCVRETRATIAFDAVGGGKLAGQILTAMEAALNHSVKVFSPYGSAVHKQVYIYGGLDPGITQLSRGFGTAWGIGGWLLFPFLEKLGTNGLERLKARVSGELNTTFASQYTREISLQETITLEVVAAWNRRATGEKFLIVPSKS
jgi:threonine dehydrogenase-like Zn-dependent dehydrogenase